ncbi:N-acetylmuramoyl-L-alanine amidase [Pararhizobium haloflavum]|uniref:N-acetylmuramoyl-L-alanine amidase n=1 Tax=Pararhizobium haloflavum TaxID=2037914 RepID=UPI000C194134|nr:N-acetylmuramoyl-L-alanine amidase [Pararhizobium haloflavum]
MTASGSEDFSPDFAGADEIRPAVNRDERAAGTSIDILLLHYTGMESERAALDWLTSAESRVSCHYFVRENGQVVQLLPERARAWHAGAGSWQGASDINSRSIGVEIANPGHDNGYRDFTERQIEAVISLCLDCGERRLIPAARILAHSDVAPGRKQDPGELFPWARLANHGVGHFVEPTPIRSGRFFQFGDRGQPVEALQSMLKLYGYGIEITGEFCETTRSNVVAFQRHFRPQRVDGVADVSTIDTLYRLLSQL